MKKCIATYLRLSLEDVDKRTNKEKDESNSINAQRQMIQRHIADNPYLSGLPQMEFCDDGFSGTNFDRPGFQEMIDLIRDGEISCVIVKDLSRFGRDYLEVGDYLEHIFPFLGIRIISLNDHYDSEDFKGNTEIKENRHREMKETISKLETEYEEFKKSDSQAKKDRAVVKQASSMDDDALKEMMYDAIEKVNISDSENIEIIWKFDDLFSVA